MVREVKVMKVGERRKIKKLLFGAKYGTGEQQRAGATDSTPKEG